MISTVPRFTIYKSNDQWIQLTGLYSLSADGYGMLTIKNYEDAATVKATLYDVNGIPVSGLIDIPMLYVAGSEGIYRGQVTAAFDPPAAKNYELVITAVSGSSELKFKVRTIVEDRPNTV